MKASLQRGGKRSRELATVWEKSSVIAAEVFERCAEGLEKSHFHREGFGRRIAARALSGTELSRVRTEYRFVHRELPSKAARVERGRHCYAIMWVPVPKLPVIRLIRS
jgi:hypothetical protein